MTHRLIPILALACLAGCRVAVIPMPDGRTALVGSCLTDPHLIGVTVNADGSFEMKGYDSKINADATKAVVSGVAEGAIRAFITKP